MSRLTEPHLDLPKERHGGTAPEVSPFSGLSAAIRGQTTSAEGGSVGLIGGVIRGPPPHGRLFLGYEPHPADAPPGVLPHTAPLDPRHKARERRRARAPARELRASREASSVGRPHPKPPEPLRGRAFRAPGALLVPLHIQRPKAVFVNAPVAPPHAEDAHPLPPLPGEMGARVMIL